jgi:hypothetical protein
VHAARSSSPSELRPGSRRTASLPARLRLPLVEGGVSSSRSLAVDGGHVRLVVALAGGRGEVVQAGDLLDAQLDRVGCRVLLDARDAFGAGDRGDVVALLLEDGGTVVGETKSRSTSASGSMKRLEAEAFRSKAAKARRRYLEEECECLQTSYTLSAVRLEGAMWPPGAGLRPRTCPARPLPGRGGRADRRPSSARRSRRHGAPTGPAPSRSRRSPAGSAW